MPYRCRMHIISLLVRREILIICIWSSRIGHGDQYNNTDIIFTCMKPICYDFEFHKTMVLDSSQVQIHKWGSVIFYPNN